jgi:hypothetical protein
VQLTPAHHDLELLAERILKGGASLQGDATDVPRATERAVDELGAHLRRVFGPAGFEALLTRSLAVSRREHAFLERVPDPKGGGLSGLVRAADGREPHEVERGCTCLFAHLMELLMTFVGEGIAFGLLRQAWPDEVASLRGGIVRSWK